MSYGNPWLNKPDSIDKMDISKIREEAIKEGKSAYGYDTDEEEQKQDNILHSTKILKNTKKQLNEIEKYLDEMEKQVEKLEKRYENIEIRRMKLENAIWN